jgi:hypothetical protein
MRLGDETRDTPFDGHFAELMSALPPKAHIGTQSWNVRFVPKADIPDDVNEKERPPCGGLSKAVRDVRYAALDF